MRILAILLCFASVAAQPAFDVASVKPAVAGGNRVAGLPEGFREAPQLSPGKFHARSIDLKALIRLAFQLPDFQISGAPAWIESANYDIDAKSESGATLEQTRVMLQNLLADRFKLKTHRESRETVALALVVAEGKKAAPKQADATGCLPEPGPANPCGNIRESNGLISFGRISMPQFAKALSTLLRTPVTDRTGLTGVFDLKLDLTQAAPPPTDANSGAMAKEMAGLTALIGVLQEQAGLKLERAKTGVEMLVIEHVEKPSEN